MSPRLIPLTLGGFALLAASPALAHDGPEDLAGVVRDTAMPAMPSGPLTVDLGTPESRARVRARYVNDAAVPQPDFANLDDHAGEDPEPEAGHVGELPEGWVQQGDMVMPKERAEGITAPPPEPLPAWVDIPGNKYPRKHTVFMNFNGGMLYVGADNSAESKSTLAKQGVYPTYTGGEPKALAAIEAFQNDVAKYGIRVKYANRPSKMVPYTMIMVGGSWQDTNLGDPAGGVAPGADCEARGQRHVVYTFASGSTGSTSIANISAQEAGHAWGLDHSVNCSSVMAYCGQGDRYFSDTCDGLCEGQCQGPAGCKATHEKYCPPGQQNEDAELTFIFGGNEPDMQPPTVEILSPSDGASLSPEGTIKLRGTVDDDYGGVGWKIYLEYNGEAQIDTVDYDKDFLDSDLNVAVDLNNPPEGDYVFRITAEDHADQVVEKEIRFSVGAAGGGDSGGGDSGGGTSGGDSGGGTSGGGTSAGDGGGSGGIESGSGTGGRQTDGGGCSVAAGQGPAGAPSLAFLVLPWLPTLRRRAMRAMR